MKKCAKHWNIFERGVLHQRVTKMRRLRIQRKKVRTVDVPRHCQGLKVAVFSTLCRKRAPRILSTLISAVCVFAEHPRGNDGMCDMSAMAQARSTAPPNESAIDLSHPHSEAASSDCASFGFGVDSKHDDSDWKIVFSFFP